MKKAFAFRSVAFLAILAFFAYPTFAQGGNRPGGGQRQGDGQRQVDGQRQYTEENVKQRVQRQAESLGLNDDQEKKILDFEMEMYKKNQVERQKYQGDREAMRAHMQEQRKLRDQKYKEVLTEEQFKLYQQKQEERMEQMRQRRENAPGGRPAGGERSERGRGRG